MSGTKTAAKAAKTTRTPAVPARAAAQKERLLEAIEREKKDNFVRIYARDRDETQPKVSWGAIFLALAARYGYSDPTAIIPEIKGVGNAPFENGGFLAVAMASPKHAMELAANGLVVPAEISGTSKDEHLNVSTFVRPSSTVHRVHGHDNLPETELARLMRDLLKETAPEASVVGIRRSRVVFEHPISKESIVTSTPGFEYDVQTSTSVELPRNRWVNGRMYWFVPFEGCVGCDGPIHPRGHVCPGAVGAAAAYSDAFQPTRLDWSEIADDEMDFEKPPFGNEQTGASSSQGQASASSSQTQAAPRPVEPMRRQRPAVPPSKVPKTIIRRDPKGKGKAPARPEEPGEVTPPTLTPTPVEKLTSTPHRKSRANVTFDGMISDIDAPLKGTGEGGETLPVDPFMEEKGSDPPPPPPKADQHLGDKRPPVDSTTFIGQQPSEKQSRPGRDYWLRSTENILDDVPKRTKKKKKTRKEQPQSENNKEHASSAPSSNDESQRE